MVLTGDQDVRIDMTHTANQITGLDLNGNGQIAADGKENAVGVHAASGYVAVDAYTRLDNGVVNETNLSKVFLGDIAYDGTGFKGDGVSTNGNIVLGGLGADTILGGIGNDFLAGGGVALSRGTGSDSIVGGRNADFLFAELSLLTNTDGNHLFLDGGSTADNTSAANGQSSQDSDWLLLQASDDDEPVTVNLSEDPVSAVVGSSDGSMGSLFTRAGQFGTLRDIENVDASGNTYGFLKGLSTTIGGAPVNADNNGLGSSAQLRINGSLANNILIGGYDNDVVSGNDGNDIIMGGNLSKLLDANLVGLVGNNDGIDVLSGGAGNDALVLELDTGTVDGGSGNDTLFLTNYTAGSLSAPTATDAASLASLLANDLNDGLTTGRIRLDLGYADHRGYRGDTLGEFTDHSDEANFTSDSDHVAGTADQTNYLAGHAATTVTGIENVIATGLGQIDYLAAGGNAATDVTFQNQQNFFATSANLELRGTDGTPVTALVGGQDGTSGLSAAEVDALYAGYIVAAGGAWTGGGDPFGNDPETPLTRLAFEALLEAGGVDIAIAGSNDGQTTVTLSINGGANVLYASSGDDILEGRTGNDSLSGGLGNDDFVFHLGNDSGFASNMSSGVYSSFGADHSGDNVDVIHKQTDAVNNATGAAGADNIWDGTFEKDFGVQGSDVVQNSSLTLGIPSNDLLSLVEAVQFVNNGATIKLTGLASTSYAGFVSNLEAALAATTGMSDVTVTLNSNNTVTLTDPGGQDFALSTQGWFFVNGGIPPNGAADWQQTVGGPETIPYQDRLIFKAYEDRSMNEGVDDNATLGSSISLGEDSYAQDLVVDFSKDANGVVQTRIAEDQSYTVQFSDLKSEDKVKVEINGVIYELQVNKNLNGTLVGGTQTVSETNDAFVARLAKFINQFMDDDTAVGAVDAAASGNTLTLIQRAYNGEQTVYMTTPVVTLTNLSGGQKPVDVVSNTSSSDIHLLDYNGLNGGLTMDNVLFVGEEFTNRSYLETAKNTGGLMNSTEAMIVNAGKDDLAGFAVNLATKVSNSTDTDNFSVHGDDFLLTGNGVDTVMAGTGDDRVEGSLGADVLDGGRNYYQVKVLNEAKARVVVMNEWQATHIATAAALADAPADIAALKGLTVSSALLIGQNQSGDTVMSGDFNDTLVYQQSDFKAGVSDFTVKLDGFTAVTPTATVRTVEFRNDGAGHVETDLNGDNVIGTNITTFSNFENIRTVSGIGHAVAGDGQGNDTLDVSALSDATFGVSYNLTGDASAGQVSFTANEEVVNAVAANANTANGDSPLTGDYEVDVIKVDGVETVVGGTGDDLVTIDETEAAKNNGFQGRAGTDRIDYQNNYNDTVDGESEPTVTISVGALNSDVDTVGMTEGALGLVVATDTLTNVEYIALNGNTAEGLREDDVLDVTALIGGAVVDYSNNEVRTGLAEGSGVQVVIENMVELENVWADGNDTVIVADHTVMNNNARSDESNGTPAEDIQLGTYFDFDEINTAGTGRRSFADQVANDTATQVINQNQFTFDMSRVGTDTDVDTIDYSHESGQITAVMNFVANDTNKYVVVGSEASSASLTDAGSRVDRLISVERIVAAAGANSTIDVTNSDRDVNVVFSYNMPNSAANFVPGTDMISALDRQINTVRVSDSVNQAALGNVDLLEFRDLHVLDTGATAVTQVQAVWETVQGSDHREYVELTQWEDGIVHNFDLRGGQNEVNYNERTNGIRLNIQSIDATVDGVASQFSLTASHLTTTGADVGTADVITGFTTANTFNEAAGVRLDTMRIEASQGDADVINVVAVGENLFILGDVESSGSTVVTLTQGGEGQGLVLSGFEFLWDGLDNDTYTINDLSNFVSKLTLVDWEQTYDATTKEFTGSTDRDTLKLTNGAFETAVIRAPIGDSITVSQALHMGDGNANDLQNLGVNNWTAKAAMGNLPNEGVLGTSVGFDFQVLDISLVTATATGASLTGLITAAGSVLGTSDELIVGNLALLSSTAVTAITNFDILSLTGAGGSYDFDLTAGQLQTAANVKIVGFDADMGTLDVSRTTSGNTITVTGGTAPAVVGSAFVDTITGGSGADVFTGGAGADLLNGGVVPVAGPVISFTLNGGAAILGTDGDRINILGIEVQADTLPATPTFVVNALASTQVAVAVGADSDTVGTAFAAVSLTLWKAALTADLGTLNTLTALEIAALESVTYDMGSNRLIFTFADSADTAGVAQADFSAAVLGGTGTVTVTTGNGLDTAYAAQIDSIDTYVYLAASDSTATAMDVITNFTIDGNAGAANDKIDLSAIDADTSTPLVADAFAGFIVSNTTRADYAAIVTALATGGIAGVNAFAANDIYVGRTAADSYVFVDTDNSHTFNSSDMVIKLAGVADLTNLAANAITDNFVL